MKNNNEDIELRKAMKGIRIESPQPEFALKVMAAVKAEQIKNRAVANEPVLGKRFWIVVGMFILLALASILVSSVQTTSGSGIYKSFFAKYFAPNLAQVETIYADLLEKLGSFPVTISLIMLTAISLILLDKALASRLHSYSAA